MVVQAKAPASANGFTPSGFAARVPGAKTPPAPYYHDADAAGIGAGEAEWPGEPGRPGQLPGGIQRRPDGRRRDRGRPRGACG